MPRTSRTRFFRFRELAKVSQAGNLSKLSAFFRFCSERFARSPHLRRAKRAKPPNCFRLFSCQISSKNAKERRLFQFLQENFRVTAPKTIFEFNNSLIFKFRERKRRRSRFSKSFFRGDLSRRRSVDNLNFQNWHILLPTDFCYSASQYLRRSPFVFGLYVSNSATSKNYLLKYFVRNLSANS